MRTLSKYNDDFDRDAAMQSEARVVNVSPHVARFMIATTAGSQPRKYRLQPGESVHIQVGYTHSFTGAGRQPVRATIESLTEMQVFAGGFTLPMVVHESKADEYRARWAEALAKGAEKPKAIDVMLPAADGGEPIKFTVQPAAAAPALVPQRPVMSDDEDQAEGPLDEPPPDHNDPIEPVEVPKAKAKGGK